MAFTNDSIDLKVLRERAYNMRWAEVDEDVIPLTAADSDFHPAPEISEAMREYNYITTERLGSEFLNVPEEFADRERKVYTSHIIIEGWKNDPREWRTNGNSKALYLTPEVTIILRIKHYGRWDVTKEEFESMRYKVSEFSKRDFREFSPYTTLEYVGMLTSGSGETEKAKTTAAKEIEIEETK